jgi:hypothetical protein
VTIELDRVELAKLTLLADGLVVAPGAVAHLDEAARGRDLQTHDYASTSGVILRLGKDVWVNAPTQALNANFVSDGAVELLATGDGLVVRGPWGDIDAAVWLPPAYHERRTSAGTPFRSYGITHADRVRVSPIEGCAFTCTFCDLPYEFRYRAKDVDGIVETVRAGLADEWQPAAHVLISGGTPRPEDYSYVRDCYEAVLESFPGVPVDIMMVPLTEVLDLSRLAGLGLREVSINIEVWDEGVARRVMPRKHKQGRDHYLDFLEHGAEVLGGERVRSMLMVGLEPMESTLEGVAAIAERGCVPVLSPFRPDPLTPLRDWTPPNAPFLAEIYAAAWEITSQYGVPLGPPCSPCAHNTLSFPTSGGHGSTTGAYGDPVLVG